MDKIMIPNEIINNIFNKLNNNDLHKVGTVCKLWYNISRYIINRIKGIINNKGTYRSKYYGNYNDLVNNDNIRLVTGYQIQYISFITPIDITKYCINLVMPTVSDTICDLCCGSGSFLVESAIYLHKNNENINWLEQCKKIYGYDINKEMVDLTITNFKISLGISMQDQIKVKDTLNHKNKYDILLLNPPFNGLRIHEQFLVTALDNLAVNGRCCIIIPYVTFINGGNAVQKLFEEFNIIECCVTKCINSRVTMVILYIRNDGNCTMVDNLIINDYEQMLY